MIVVASYQWLRVLEQYLEVLLVVEDRTQEPLVAADDIVHDFAILVDVVLQLLQAFRNFSSEFFAAHCLQFFVPCCSEKCAVNSLARFRLRCVCVCVMNKYLYDRFHRIEAAISRETERNSNTFTNDCMPKKTTDPDFTSKFHSRAELGAQFFKRSALLTSLLLLQKTNHEA